MKRITLGRQVVDLAQIDTIVVSRRGFLKHASLAGFAMGLGGLVALTQDASGLSTAIVLGILAIAVIFAGWRLFMMLSAPFVLDINYKGGRGVRIECISRGHGEEMKADLLGRLALMRK
jgi:hypothetical protein